MKSNTSRRILIDKWSTDLYRFIVKMLILVHKLHNAYKYCTYFINYSITQDMILIKYQISLFACTSSCSYFTIAGLYIYNHLKPSNQTFKFIKRLTNEIVKL